MGKNFLKSSLQNASFNIIFQVGFRLITFLLNAFVLRNVSDDVIGVMNVRLLLLESTVLFLSREAFRRACLSNSSSHDWPQVINLVWLTVPLCGVLCVFFGWIWLAVLPRPDVSITRHYTLGVYSVCISCILSSTIEPLYLVSQAFLFVKMRVLIETISVTFRTAVFTILVLYQPKSAVVAFSVAQLLSLLVYAVSYIMYFKQYMTKPDEDFPFKSMTDFLPRSLSDRPLFNWSLLILVWSFLKQGILKQVLTEGERYVMTLFSVLTFSQQGVYDVVNNLGSLAARFLFRPIEESAYFYFSQLVLRDVPVDEQNQADMREAARVLRELIRCILSLCLVVFIFGQSYSRLLLFIYGGQSLSSSSLGPILLRTHCFSIFLLGLNGVTEAYTLATMNAGQIDRFNRLMAFLSAGFLLISWGLTQMIGAVGFILANCCNMAFRIAHSIKFIRSRYSTSQFSPLEGCTPKKKFLTVAIGSGLVAFLSEQLYYETSKVAHLAIGLVMFVATVLAWVYEESELVSLGVQRLRRQSVIKSD